MAGENVIIRPMGSGVGFVQLDDLKSQERIDRVRPAAFIIHETSPGFLGGTPLIVNDVLARMPLSSPFLTRMINSGKTDWEEMLFP
jgi:hypothetical protein